jgi:hypothetical protein
LGLRAARLRMLTIWKPSANPNSPPESRRKMPVATPSSARVRLSVRYCGNFAHRRGDPVLHAPRKGTGRSKRKMTQRPAALPLPPAEHSGHERAAGRACSGTARTATLCGTAASGIRPSTFPARPWPEPGPGTAAGRGGRNARLSLRCHAAHSPVARASARYHARGYGLRPATELPSWQERSDWSKPMAARAGSVLVRMSRHGTARRDPAPADTNRHGGVPRRSRTGISRHGRLASPRG